MTALSIPTAAYSITGGRLQLIETSASRAALTYSLYQCSPNAKTQSQKVSYSV